MCEVGLAKSARFRARSPFFNPPYLNGGVFTTRKNCPIGPRNPETALIPNIQVKSTPASFSRLV